MSTKKHHLFSPYLRECFHDLATLKGYDSDGDDVSPVHTELIGLCKDIVHILLQKGYGQPEVAATSSGTIDFMWDDLGVFCVLSEPEHGLMVTLSRFPLIYEPREHKYEYAPTTAGKLADLISQTLIKAIKM